MTFNLLLGRRMVLLLLQASLGFESERVGSGDPRITGLEPSLRHLWACLSPAGWEAAVVFGLRFQRLPKSLGFVTLKFSLLPRWSPLQGNSEATGRRGNTSCCRGKKTGIFAMGPRGGMIHSVSLGCLSLVCLMGLPPVWSAIVQPEPVIFSVACCLFTLGTTNRSGVALGSSRCCWLDEGQMERYTRAILNTHLPRFPKRLVGGSLFKRFWNLCLEGQCGPVDTEVKNPAERKAPVRVEAAQSYGVMVVAFNYPQAWEVPEMMR